MQKVFFWNCSFSPRLEVAKGIFFCSPRHCRAKAVVKQHPYHRDARRGEGWGWTGGPQPQRCQAVQPGESSIHTVWAFHKGLRAKAGKSVLSLRLTGTFWGCTCCGALVDRCRWYLLGLDWTSRSVAPHFLPSAVRSDLCRHCGSQSLNPGQSCMWCFGVIKSKLVLCFLGCRWEERLSW